MSVRYISYLRFKTFRSTSDIAEIVSRDRDSAGFPRPSTIGAATRIPAIVSPNPIQAFLLNTGVPHFFLNLLHQERLSFQPFEKLMLSNLPVLIDVLNNW